MENRTPRYVAVLIAALVLGLLGLGWPARQPAAERASAPPASDSPGAAAAATGSEVQNGRWTPAQLGVSLVVPAGWTHTRRDVRSYLMLDVLDPLAGNVSALRMPNFFGRDLNGLREENRVALQDNDFLELDGIEDVEVSGHPALAIDYHGSTAASTEPLRFRGLVFLRGDWQIVVTASARSAAWLELQTIFDDCLGSLTITADRAAPIVR